MIITVNGGGGGGRENLNALNKPRKELKKEIKIGSRDM